jgi:hypothetical protein
MDERGFPGPDPLREVQRLTIITALDHDVVTPKECAKTLQQLQDSGNCGSITLL